MKPPASRKVCNFRRSAAWLSAAAALSLAAAASRGADAAGAAPVPAPSEPAVWQHHEAKIDYFGITSVYTCDGIEKRIRQLLLFLGAREDLKVAAGGCGLRDMPIGGSLTVSVNFYALSPVSGGGATDRVQAQWSATRLDEHSPTYMAPGDCELIEQLRDVLTRNFSWRGLEYHASCMPHVISIDSYGVRGEVLKISPAHPG